MTKRQISEKEIENLLNDIKVSQKIPYETALSVEMNIKESLRKQLRGLQIYPSTLPKICKKITQFYHRTKIEPGECVGVVTAQSIGERQTQITLDTFHSAGLTTQTVYNRSS